MATVDADILLLATTRPQGYSYEFSPKFYNHRFLLPLSKKRAIHYADKLVNTRYGNDPDRCLRIMKRLTIASEQETTQRLMRTPLQVTIMATLVDKIGQPPQERWRLFQQYYEVIYSRETEREIPASRILQQRKADVLAIHQRVGLFLQIESEKPGSTESKLSIESFKKIVRARIKEEGHEAEELERRTNEIVEAALYRLVFLVGLEDNKIGFEIRSLQEFMAAEALMNGKEDLVRKRLLAISPISNWRNVFLFAVGKCFAEVQYLRDMIVVICKELNDQQNDKLLGIVKIGSRLALDILEEAVVREQPKYERIFLELAFELLDIDDKNVHLKLSSLYNPSLEIIYTKKITQQLNEIPFNHQKGAWIILFSLINRDIIWAQELFNQYWPTNITKQMKIIEEIELNSSFILKLLEGLITKFPIFPNHILWRKDKRFLSDKNLPEWFKSILYIENIYLRERTQSRFNLTFNKIRLKFSIRLIKDLELQKVIPIKDSPTSEPSWVFHKSGARFANNPNAKTLKEELIKIRDIWNPNENSLRYVNYGWPFDSCVSSCKAIGDLDNIISLIESGELGDQEDWLLAEKRWRLVGISWNDLESSHLNWPFRKNITDIGFPFAACYSFSTGRKGKKNLEIFNTFYELLNHSNPESFNDWIYNIIVYFLQVYVITPPLKINPKMLKEIFENCNNGYIHINLFKNIIIPEELDEEWLDFFRYIAEIDYKILYGPIRKLPNLCDTLVNSYLKVREKFILKLICNVSDRNKRNKIPQDILLNLLENGDIDEKLFASIIILSTSNWPDSKLELLVDSLINEDSKYAYWWQMGIYSARRNTQKNMNLESLMIYLFEKYRNIFNDEPYLYSILLELADKRNSNLTKKKNWEELKLPDIL